ncbi:MAG: response regulator [candidate division KSB1 bacterium]|nr:response regulator [candidate division KSB1 bacterium]MDZ7274279.1 response regulator [candidate division KSB1 bacterium]MDZ7287199.1 response regulator [candidate division KSB1 bacterium]MDZ7296876.1 response regulator [candidate division KSB1 bacterium]MDZ7306019.1 response regulator [candidate division KSB1 bacterium]
MVAILVVAMILAFIVIDVLVRMIARRLQEAKARKERLAALDIGLRLDFTHEAKTLRRVDVPHPLARILAVDDEPVVLDSFRKILVVAGYAVDTVESGREALGLVQKYKYDFVFTDLKMPEMDGLDVVKGVKHFSPETDVVVITGYATIESAVNAMKFGALDYVQKPFTEDELVEFTRKCLIRRQDRLEKQIKPVVHVVTTGRPPEHEFLLPGGVFISEGHVWANVTVPGLVRVGMDDFVRKMIGRIDAIELPAKGRRVKKGEPLFYVQQGGRRAAFKAPISGTVHLVNTELAQNLSWLEKQPYEKGWICSIKPDQLSAEIEQLRIGEKAAAWYQQEIKRVRELLMPAGGNGHPAILPEMARLVEGQLEETDDNTWKKFAESFL